MQALFTTRPAGRAASVLLVDDDTDLRRLYGHRLQADGYKVFDAADGPQALTAAARAPSLILLDFRMPGMSGLEVLRRLKGDGSTACLPVVMLSSEGDPEVMAACQALGAIAWWSKHDLLPAELSRRVGELLAVSTLSA